MATDNKHIAPHWIMRLLGAKSATFTLHSDGISVHSNSGDQYTILIESLIDEAILGKGVFFSQLVLNTDKGIKTFGGLRERDARQLFNWLRQFWLEQLTPVISHIATLIQSIVSKGYLRSSRLSIVQSLAKMGWITSATSDGGADFYGRLDVGSGFGQAKLIVLGQAKCESFSSPTGGNHIARTVARLRRVGWVFSYHQLLLRSRPAGDHRG